MNKVIEFLKDDWKRSDFKKVLLWSFVGVLIFMTGFVLGDHIMNPPVYTMSDAQFQSFTEGLATVFSDENAEAIELVDEPINGYVQEGFVKGE